MGDVPITGFDILVGAVLIISGLLAYARGFVHEVLSIAAWIGAFFITVYLFPVAQPFAHQYIEAVLLADITAGAALFIVSLIVLSMLTRAISRRIRDSALNALDRALGFVFGLVRGAVIVCLAYIGIAMLWPPADQPAWMREARSMPLVETGAAWLKSLVPDETRDRSGQETSTTKTLDSEKVLRDMITPKPKGSEAPAKEGYGAKVRQELDRLIETTK
jgi:membrane protein required for colicin V production